MDEIYLQAFCREFDYPPEAIRDLLAGVKAITETAPLCEIMTRRLEDYEQDRADEPAMVEALKELRTAVPEGVSRYTVELIYFIFCSRHLWEKYAAANMPYEIYKNSMLDLKWKLIECHNVYGIWGSFVADWFPRFFQMGRFALGRLQYEPYQLTRDVTIDGVEYHKGMPIINVHIPSAGPLDPEAVIASFRQATEFYADLFEGDTVPFMCHSWLLYAEHENYLPKDSRILQFAHCFRIATVDPNDGFDLWRIFNIPENADWRTLLAEGKLPADTSVRRAYIKLLSDGVKPGGSLGLRFEKK